MKYKGYMGKIIRINLSSKKIWLQEITDEMACRYLGGNGFAARILYDELKPGIDALSPENKIFIGSGPLNGTRIPFCVKTYAASKSPLTGLWGDTNCGGHFSAELKFTGHDAVVVEGKAEKPVYISILDDEIKINDASHLWGKTTYETEEIIKKDLGEKGAYSIGIGPAGENLVRFACLISNYRAGGRCGLGAVMGSKNLKAIAVKGSRDIEVADLNGLERYVSEVRFKKFPGSTLDKGYSTLGTPMLQSIFNKLGLLGTKNWTDEVFDEIDKISYDALHKYEIKRSSCFGCIAHCCGVYKVIDGPYAGVMNEGPEYESIYALGPMCLNSDAASLIKMDRMCDELGLDTISTGVTLAFAMECREKGILKKEDTDGIDLRFGNPEAMILMIERIAYRKGFGSILAEGTKKAAEKIGKGAEYYAINTKGLEHPGHSTRGTKGMALSYAIGNRGAHHHDGRDFEYSPNPLLGYNGDTESIEGKGKMVAKITRWTAFADCCCYCHFAEKVYGILISQEHVTQINLVTGMDVTLEDLWRIGERVYTLERLFNVREGVRRSHDTVPERFFKEPIPRGPHKAAILTQDELNKMLDEFYEDYGWNKKTGIPTEERLKLLGLYS
jgi:aldehyde:ferredoxin oxidoreductase